LLNIFKLQPKEKENNDIANFYLIPNEHIYLVGFYKRLLDANRSADCSLVTVQILTNRSNIQQRPRHQCNRDELLSQYDGESAPQQDYDSRLITAPGKTAPSCWDQ
jgi:hypothetical protein